MAPQAWQRWETGPDAESAWAAFSDFLHLAAPRPSIAAYADTHRAPRDVLRWSFDWLWAHRVTAYDEYVCQAKMRKVYPCTHPLILSVVRMCLTELRKYEAAQALSQGHGFFSVKECLGMLREVRAAERDITRLTKEQEETKASGGVVHDFSKLTLEEQRILDGLLEKVTQR